MDEMKWRDFPRLLGKNPWGKGYRDLTPLRRIDLIPTTFTGHRRNRDEIIGYFPGNNGKIPDFGYHNFSSR
jgi:hypothetical protein